MSFILDALKRADAERAHGRVPGIHTQATPPGRPVAALRQPVRPYLLLSGVVIALLCLALWNWLRPSLAASNSPETPPPVAAISPPVPSAISPTPVAVATPPETQASASPPAAAITTNRYTTSTNAQAAMKPPIQAKTPAKPVATAERPPESRAQPLVAAPTAPPASPSPSPTLNELPEDIRQALPKLIISGSIYSETAAHRMLIINGQVFREGEKPAPNLELEQINPKTAIFNFKGQRYSMGY